MLDKFKIVVSDLHLSAGHVAEGNPLEDFGSDRAFAALMDEIAAESNREGAEVELIVNGDAFEMLQVPHVDVFDPIRVYPPKHYHSSSEQDSVLKMDIIIAGHQPFFEALARFVQAGPPRRYVTFVKGNHDLNLHWPAVQECIRQAVGATGSRASLLAFEERRICREGIYVEHGNQYAEVVDRVKDMEEPHDHDKPGQLAIPPGSWFVMDVFNDVEREKYWIDGIKPTTALVWYTLIYDFAFAARAIATLAHRLPGIFQEIVFEVPESGEPDPLADLVDRAGDPAQVEELAARYDTDEAYRNQFNAALAAMLPPPPELAGLDFAPSTAVLDPGVMGDQIRERVNSSLYDMAATRAAEEGVKLVTFGHTHDAGLEPLPDGAVYINSGTWTWRTDLTGADKELWQELFAHPERFTEARQLSYVRLDYDEAGEPEGRLMAYEPPPVPGPEPVVNPPQPSSFWERLLAWWQGLWERVAT